MKIIHAQEKEQFEILFKQESIDRFNDRYRVMEAFLQNENHMTAEELTSLLESEGARFPVDFVENTLELMCQFGFARENRFHNGHSRYEHRHLGHHHDHMICTKCGAIVEFNNAEMERLQSSIAASHGFHMLQHRMEIYGICSGCLKDRLRNLPLSAARQGERLRIMGFSGGSGSRMRLMSMGIRAEDIVEVISNLNQGQVVIAIDAKRFVLGQGLAQKILVEPVSESSEPLAPVDESRQMPMSAMREGQKGTIFRVGGNGALRRRLLEMGLTRGSEITIEKYAPLRDPLELVVKGYHVSLRVEEASHILVDHVSE